MMKICLSLWNECLKEFYIALHSPYMMSLAAGILPVINYRDFAGQGLHILNRGLKMFELLLGTDLYLYEGFDKNPIKWALPKLEKSYDALIEAVSVDVIPSPRTVDYREFLSETTLDNVAVNTVARMMPHIQLYSFICTEIQRHTSVDDNARSHPAKDWIIFYSCDAFQVLVTEAMRMLDKLSAPLAGNELDPIRKVYKKSMSFELNRIMEITLGPSVVPLTKAYTGSHFVIGFDFDRTCTHFESATTLTDIRIEKELKSDEVQSETQIARIRSAFREFNEEYMQLIHSILTAEPVEEFGEESYDMMKTTLDKLSEIEKKLNTRVVRFDVLKGLNSDEIRLASERLVLQNGCIGFIESVTNNVNISTHCISTCWSDDLIKLVFSSGGLQEGKLNIHANQLIYGEDSIVVNSLFTLESPLDKAIRLQEIIDECDSNNRKFIIYIGDTLDDLYCLLVVPHIGILIESDDKIMKDVGEQLGITS